MGGGVSGGVGGGGSGVGGGGGDGSGGDGGGGEGARAEAASRLHQLYLRARKLPWLRHARQPRAMSPGTAAARAPRPHPAMPPGVLPHLVQMQHGSWPMLQSAQDIASRPNLLSHWAGPAVEWAPPAQNCRRPPHWGRTRAHQRPPYASARAPKSAPWKRAQGRPLKGGEMLTSLHVHNIYHAHMMT